MKTSPKLKRLMHLLIMITISVFGSSACTDNKSEEAEENVIITGVVQKGQFTQLDVTVFPLDKDTGLLGEQSATSSSTNSSFELELPASGFYQFQVTGTFINEINGEEVSLAQPLLSIIEMDENQTTTNINLYTHLTALKSTSMVNAGVSLPEALVQATQFVQ